MKRYRSSWKPYVPPSYRKKRAKKVLAVLGAAVLLAALAVGFFFVRQKFSGELARFRDIFSGSGSAADKSGFSVHYLDVGEADAALVLCDGRAMLIDGGNKADAGFVYTYLLRQGVDRLDYIVATHPHEDHMGGLPGALNCAGVGHALSPVTDDDTVFFETFETYLRRLPITVPEPGDTFPLGSATVEEALSQAGPPEEREETAYVLNTSSKKFHRMFCLSAAQLDGSRKEIFTGARDELLARGYSPCSWCDEIQ